MNLRLVIVALLGVALAAYLILEVGFAEVFKAALAVGWGGFAILCMFGLLLFLPLGAAWFVLLEGLSPARFAVLIWGRMVRDSAGEVLPFSQVGGFVIGARAIILKSVPAPVAFGSTIVDVTTEMMAQIAYIILGITLLIARAPDGATTQSLTFMLVAGVLIAAAAAGLFVGIQRSGVWITDRLASHWLPERIAHAAAVAASIDAIYRRPFLVGLSFGLHFASWVASALISWLAFRLMGAAVDLGAVIAIDSLVFGVRSVAFIVPNALGVQEAAYAVLAPLFGVGPELGLAVSLLKRARDIAIGTPVLIAWQAMEGRNALSGGGADGKLLNSE